jgi:uncharacterized circularly permuted ATP-grasp superfamily protein
MIKVIKDKIIPKELILSSCIFEAVRRLYAAKRHLVSHYRISDLIKGGDGQYYVLEDNLRCPSGVSYMLENREILKRTFPELSKN